jgi:hypothetical protein
VLCRVRGCGAFWFVCCGVDLYWLVCVLVLMLMLCGSAEAKMLVVDHAAKVNALNQGRRSRVL